MRHCKTVRKLSLLRVKSVSASVQLLLLAIAIEVVSEPVLGFPPYNPGNPNTPMSNPGTPAPGAPIDPPGPFMSCGGLTVSNYRNVNNVVPPLQGSGQNTGANAIPVYRVNGTNVIDSTTGRAAPVSIVLQALQPFLSRLDTPGIESSMLEAVETVLSQVIPTARQTAVSNPDRGEPLPEFIERLIESNARRPVRFGGKPGVRARAQEANPDQPSPPGLPRIGLNVPGTSPVFNPQDPRANQNTGSSSRESGVPIPPGINSSWYRRMIWGGQRSLTAIGGGGQGSRNPDRIIAPNVGFDSPPGRSTRAGSPVIPPLMLTDRR